MKKEYMVKFERESYTVSFKDELKINCIKIKLFIKRQSRRLKLIFAENTFVYCFIILCWSLFILLSWIWGRHYKGQYSLTDALWDLKNPIFSSVFLALVINGYNKVKQYKGIIRAQHYLYVDTLHDFGLLLSGYLGKSLTHYIPFYNDLCIKQTKTYIHNHYADSRGMLIKNGCISDDDIERVLIRLEVIEKEIRSNQIIGIKDNVNDVLRTIDKTKENIKKYKTTKSFKEMELYSTISKLYDLVDILRQPWRRDIEEKIKILKILEKYPRNKTGNDFYYSMLLCGYTEKMG